MTEPLTFLDPALIETLRPGCQYPHGETARWIAAWDFPCDCGTGHDLLCDGHAGEIRWWDRFTQGRWSCASCSVLGRLVSLVRL